MFSESLAPFIRENEPLAPYCWLRIGGWAKFYAEAPNTAVLQELCAEAQQNQLAVRILGGGSNLLIRSGQIDALVIRLTEEFLEISTDGNILRAGSAALLSDTLSTAAKAGLAGLEHFAGIPGTVGGAVVCNSGVTNDDIGSHVKSVTAVSRDGAQIQMDRESLKFRFRRSNLEDLVVTRVELELEPLDPKEVTRRLQANWIVKKAAQPPTGARVAQAFIEPSGSRIVDLLDAAGMRSASEGDAAMNSQYPGFVLVNENADAESVLALTKRISRAVEAQSGIQLQPQLKIW